MASQRLRPHLSSIDLRRSTARQVNNNKRMSDSNYLFPEVQGRLMYWHMGSNRKARATVAMTAIINGTFNEMLRRRVWNIGLLTGCAHSE